jgi:hypothetical protein
LWTFGTKALTKEQNVRLKANKRQGDPANLRDYALRVQEGGDIFPAPFYVLNLVNGLLEGE